TPGTAPGNQISGNRLSGVVISGQSATGNMVLGNLIGTNKDGDDALANTEDGITIVDAPKNTIGGTVAGARQIISGNLGRDESGIFIGGNGIRITGQAATGNQAQGNFIGTDITGSFELPNRRNGVQIDDASDNVVGGTTAGARNVISGNKGDGV